ncbi:MAG: hypothetical protein ACFB0B_07935 [Thermonemataceae bacterium]
MQKFKGLFTLCLLTLIVLFTNCRRGEEGDPGPQGPPGMDADGGSILPDLGTLTLEIEGAQLSDGTDLGGSPEVDVFEVDRGPELLPYATATLRDGGGRIEISTSDTLAQSVLEINIGLNSGFEEISSLSDIDDPDLVNFIEITDLRCAVLVGNQLQIWTVNEFASDTPSDLIDIDELTYNEEAGTLSLDIEIRDLFSGFENSANVRISGEIAIVEIKE